MSVSRNAPDRQARSDGSSREPLATAFRRHLDRTRLIPARSHVLVALSGGIDSVVLLHLLRFHCRDRELQLSAAHFDHRMRPSSDADAEWVRGLCHAWDVRLDIGRSDVIPRNEAEARHARYSFLERVTAACGADCTATAHHADDQAETVLFRLLRGNDLSSLAGIPDRRGRVVRPLLPFTRNHIEKYAAQAGVQFREDPTNLDLRYSRNRIRHVVLPSIEQAAPGFTRSLLRLARDVAKDEAAWRTITKHVLDQVVRAQDAESIQLARPELLGYHRHVMARVIRATAGRFGARPGRAGTHAALTFITSGSSGGAVELAGGVRLERHFERFLIRRAAQQRADQPLVIAEPGSGRGEAVIGGRTYTVQWSAGFESGPAGAATFPLTPLRFPLEFRAWRPGDRIRLAAGTKKLKKLFVERRVPRHERRKSPVLAEPDGCVLWIMGLARAWRAEPEPGARVFQFRVMDEHSG